VGRVVLHIGVMKTGTSFLQAVLQANQELLAGAGFSYLGGRSTVQSKAVRSALAGRGAAAEQRWRRLAEIAGRDERTALVSMEFLSFAGTRQVPRLLRPFEGLPVDVVVTVRDELRVVPAQWQSYCRNFGTSEWGRYLREIEHGTDDQGRGNAFKKFRRAQSVGAVLDRWQASPLVSSVQVVTVPAAGAPRDVLWHRFRDAVGLPDGPFDLRMPENGSLGYGSCDYLRRANRALGDLPRPRYAKAVRMLVRDVLAPRRADESRPVVDRRAAAFAGGLNGEIRDRLTSGRFVLHGSVDDLPVPTDLDAFPEVAPAVPGPEVRAAAEDVWWHLRDRAGSSARRPPRRLDGVVADTTGWLRRLPPRTGSAG
jgi:hypothetical protein